MGQKLFCFLCLCWEGEHPWPAAPVLAIEVYTIPMRKKTTGTRHIKRTPKCRTWPYWSQAVLKKNMAVSENGCVPLETADCPMDLGVPYVPNPHECSKISASPPECSSPLPWSLLEDPAKHGATFTERIFSPITSTKQKKPSHHRQRHHDHHDQNISE